MQTRKKPEENGKKANKYRIFLLVLAIVTLVTTALFTQNTGSHTAPTTKSASTSGVAEATQSKVGDPVTGYWARHNQMQDVYWMKDLAENPDQWYKATTRWTQETEAALEKYRDTSELSRKIHRRYNKFFVTQFRDGSSQALSPYGQEMDEKLDLLNNTGIEITLVPENQFIKWHNKMPSSLYYRRDWNALMVVALTMPIDVRTALIYHELGHAYKNTVEHAPSATAPNNSNSFIEEELEMHRLEYDIMNRSTGGQLAKLYQSIITRVGGMDDPPRTLNSVTSNDLEAYDRMLGIETAGPKMTGVYLAQFYTGFGFHLFTGTPAEQHEMQIQFYRMITSH